MTNSQIQFDETKYNRNTKSTQNSFLIKFLIEKNIVKNEQQANYVLIGITCVCICIMVWFFINRDKSHPFTNEEIRITEQAGSPSEITY